MTHNLRTIHELPLRLKTGRPPAIFEARGEVYMTREELARLNRRRAEKGLKLYDNPRNTTAGTGFMHESFQKDDPTVFTRKWFAWANTLFGELIVTLAARNFWG